MSPKEQRYVKTTTWLCSLMYFTNAMSDSLYVSVVKNYTSAQGVAFAHRHTHTICAGHLIQTLWRIFNVGK